MSAPRKTLTDRLDDLAYMTGIPKLIIKLSTLRRRPMKWWPLVIIMIASIGYGLMIADNHKYVGMGVLVLCLALTSIVMALGPLKFWGNKGLVDEREKLERSRAYLFAFTICFGITYCALLVLGITLETDKIDRSWVARLVMFLPNYMLVLLYTLPTLYASWKAKPLEDLE